MDSLCYDIVHVICKDISDIRAFSCVAQNIHKACANLPDWKFWLGWRDACYVLPKMLGVVETSHFTHADYCAAGNMEVVKCLDFTQDYDKCMHICVEHNQLDIAKYITKFATNWNSFHYDYLYQATISNRLEFIKWLGELGVHPDAKYLYSAISYNCLEVIGYFVQTMIDINDLNGWPLKYAASIGNIEVVKYLVSVGADIQTSEIMNRLDEYPENIRDYFQSFQSM